MTNLLEVIRAEDEFCELYDLATKIRNQKLFTDAELHSLNRHKQQLVESEVKLLTEAWRSAFWNNVARQLKNQSLNPTNACRLLKEVNETEALPAYKHVSYHFSDLETLFTILYNEPHSVAEILHNVDENDANRNDSIIQAFLQTVYSHGLYLEDELRLSQVVCNLLKLQLTNAGENMRTMLRKEISMSTRLYKHYVELMHPTMVYLTKALRQGVLAVIQLGNFWLDIDAKQSAVRFLNDNKQDENRLHEYRALVVSKLVSLVDTFLEDVAEALPMLPPHLNWIIQDVFGSMCAIGGDSSTNEFRHACKDMIVSNLICPAIISPQKFGIVDNDVRIGFIVNHNLVQVAMIIQMISLNEFESPHGDYNEFLSQCRNTRLISEMMESLLLENLAPDVKIISLIANGEAQSDMTKKSSFIGSISDVNTLIKVLRSIPLDTNPELARIKSQCEKLPPSFTSTNDKNQSANWDSPEKASTFRALHKKVQNSFKRPSELPEESNENKLNFLDSAGFQKEYFDILYLDYSQENYKRLILEQTKTEHIATPILCAENQLEGHATASSTCEYEPIIDIDIEQSTPQIETSEEPNIPKEHGYDVDVQANDSQGSFSKLKNFGDKFKKGIIQSNTFSDLRGQLRRSASLMKPQSGLVSSSSEQLLGTPTSGPRDDILAKYATSPPTKEAKQRADNSITIMDSHREIQESEPYYNSDNIESCRAFQNTSRKILTVLGNISYFPRIGYRNSSCTTLNNKKVLMEQFLDGVLVETEHRRDYGQAAQIREVKRCIELFEHDGVHKLIDNLKMNESNQEEIIAGMREERVSLMRRSNDLSSLEQRVLLNRQLTEEIIVDFLMRTFLETGFSQKNVNGKTAEVAAVLKFYEEFKSLLAHDERAEFLQNLLTYLKERLFMNLDWNHATDSMVNRAMKTIERYVMFSVYDAAFYPNCEIDKHRDKLLRLTIGKVANVVTPMHDFLKIPEHLLSEAPWPSAQAELSLLDIYVTAQDKLSCVVRCCDVINNLIALSSKNAIASADDFTPVLVFVLIKANPRSLLSNLQFIETFAGDRTASGRDAYYWTNFKSAVEYIKTIL